MPNDPILLSWLRQHEPNLSRFAGLMQRAGEYALHSAGFDQTDIVWAQTELPRLSTLIRGILDDSNIEDRAMSNVVRRIHAKTGPELDGCKRWLGSTAGGTRERAGATPVIGYLGSSTPARRLIWQLTHAGTDRELSDDERLRNIGCREGSLCMALAHWYKPNLRPAQGTVRAILQTLPAPAGKLCRRGHRLPLDATDCPTCRAISTTSRQRELDMAHNAGLALRQQLRAVSGPLRPQTTPGPSDG